jgi:Tfp pilus assembly protein PilE
MDGFILLLVLVAIIGVLVFIAKVVFVGFVIKQGIDAYQAHQQAFEQAMREQQNLLGKVARSGRTSSPQMATHFQAAWLRAQNEMRQLDDLRRQQSELRLSEMTSQAAEAGIFIDPSSL